MQVKAASVALIKERCVAAELQSPAGDRRSLETSVPGCETGMGGASSRAPGPSRS